jgi:L-threonylcarbamoyladenylate synthase
LDRIGEKRKVPVIRTEPSRNFQSAINRAVDSLLSGGLVAYPTESFYGLAVDARNEEAIQRLFWAKKRQRSRPVLILIPSVEILSLYAEDPIPPIARRLVETFWPGGLTLVFKAGRGVSPLLTAGTDKIGIRLSSHPVAAALAHAMGVPISGTSANISGEPACRNPEEVLACFGEGVDLILDGGRTAGGVGSTVLDVTVDPPRILREGMVHRRRLEEIIGNRRISNKES